MFNHREIIKYPEEGPIKVIGYDNNLKRPMLWRFPVIEKQKENMSKIITNQLPSKEIDVNKAFANYKYARQEHPPIRLSNGKWLHSYRVTPYNDEDPSGDPDVENDAFNNEQFG